MVNLPSLPYCEDSIFLKKAVLGFVWKVRWHLTGKMWVFVQKGIFYDIYLPWNSWLFGGAKILGRNYGWSKIKSVEVLEEALWVRYSASYQNIENSIKQRHHCTKILFSTVWSLINQWNILCSDAGCHLWHTATSCRGQNAWCVE